jgi:hypothetical protein
MFHVKRFGTIDRKKPCNALDMDGLAERKTARKFGLLRRWAPKSFLLRQNVPEPAFGDFSSAMRGEARSSDGGRKAYLNFDSRIMDGRSSIVA